MFTLKNEAGEFLKREVETFGHLENRKHPQVPTSNLRKLITSKTTAQAGV